MLSFQPQIQRKYSSKNYKLLSKKRFTNNVKEDIMKGEQRMESAKKELDGLNVIDDFLFYELLSGDRGEWFCKMLIKAMCGREVKDVRITPQCVLQGTDLVNHGIRMDLLVDEKEGVLYDIEPDKYTDRKALPRRARYYHSLSDSKLLKAGKDYRTLRDLWVVFILPYDPFGENRMSYTFRTMCEELPNLKYEDGAKTIYLNTRGNIGGSGELAALLKYTENSTEDNVTTEELSDLHNYVKSIKKKREVGVRYMKSWERDRMMQDMGWENGKAEGEILGIDKVNLLNCRLIHDHRTEDMFRAAQDNEFQKELMKEYCI